MNHDGACQPVLNTQQSVAFEYDDHFEQLLDELGIREVIGDDDEALRTMWNNLKVIFWSDDNRLGIEKVDIQLKPNNDKYISVGP